MMAFDASELSQAERFVIERTAEGEIADLAALAEGGQKPIVRATFLRRLLLQLDPDWRVRMPGVRIRAARIEGGLDLTDCSGAGGAGLPSLELIDCDIPEPMDFSHARLARLSLQGSTLQHLRAHSIALDGPLNLKDVKPHEGINRCWIDALGASIDGDVTAHGAQLAAPLPRPAEELVPGDLNWALRLSDAHVTGTVFMARKFSARGGVSLGGATIEGDVWLRDASLLAGEDDALNAQGARIGGVLGMDSEFLAIGCVWLLNAKIGAGVSCEGATFRHSSDDSHIFAIHAGGIEVNGDVMLRNGCEIDGGATFFGARVGGNFDIDNATLRNENKYALILDNARIGGSLSAEDAHAIGQISLAGGEFARNLNFSRADLSHPLRRNGGKTEEFGAAIDATNVRVGGAALLRGTKVKGELMLADARIEGYLAFGGGRFINPSGWAIRAPNARVGGNLTLKAQEGEAVGKTIIDGGAKFDRARIEGEVRWDQLELRGKSPDRKAGPTLSFAQAQIGRRLVARNLIAQDALIDLSGASCASLDDDVKTGWGLPATKVRMQGFSYDRLEGGGADDRWRTRARWLKERAADKSSQPYSALAAVYARAGQREDMRRILLAEHDARTRAAPWGPTRLLSSLFGLAA
ncbi:MAG: hypothetical protein AB7O04_13330, partial [Hyphomonadaceae bacterium]